ncbi:DODA-type extradiol aromatic ring-opening family dioxygenase [Sulfurisoma sediminicola]|uniref:4,5-DOPA dioxygenase extradiol n=1 Tax=Sulfurisoma sediminicola TaxID=1381557 RepID=A0A497XDZ1_9PROT|nr:class III extradiol ring-cleavage dioxygenase [Sulfurisoma sediminicola]RLJ65222.1 4,5-DOPA dioxygenase extradiol [Sulfurisoma sediminicola]
MAARMPVIFVSHGSPDALLHAHDAVACWGEIGRSLPEPAAILAVSAHWEARTPTASLAGAPATIHDFYGFPPALYRMRYPAPGAPALAERAVALLAGAGIAAGLHPDRGLDHGAWVPLSAMFPEADVPVTQLSLHHDGGPAAHLAVGRALAPLRDERVLIVASGAITHNFDWIDRAARPDAAPRPEAVRFADWVGERLATHDSAALLDYRAAPHGAASHPSEEHFLPLFAAVGAAGNDVPRRLRPNFAYRGLAMDAYVWVAA